MRLPLTYKVTWSQLIISGTPYKLNDLTLRNSLLDQSGTLIERVKSRRDKMDGSRKQYVEEVANGLQN